MQRVPCHTGRLFFDDDLEEQVRDPREFPCADVNCYAGFAEMDEATITWWNKQAMEREQPAEAARGEWDVPEEDAEGEKYGGHWTWGASLRLQWATAQRIDKELTPCFSRAWKPPHDERLAQDGLVEKLVDVSIKASVGCR